MARHARSSAHGALLALLFPLMVVLTSPPAQAADRDCGELGSQRSAQLFFLRHGGPSRDPHRLDADHDGIACETNPAPYYFRRRLPDAGPPPPVRSTVRLSTRPRAAIEGEALALRVRVRPRLERTVVLQRKAPTGWKQVVTRTTSSRGKVTYRTSTRASTTTYRAVLLARRVGDRRYLGDVSPRRQVVSQSQTVRLGLPNAVLTGETFTAVAEVAPVRHRRKVELQRRKDGRWVIQDVGRESRRGRVEFELRFGKAKARTFRAVVRAAGGAEAVASDRDRVRVSDPVPSDTFAPPVPTGLLATPGDGEVHLTWARVDAADLSEYVVYRREPDGQWTEVQRTPAEEVDVLGLVNGVASTFAVTAVDALGNESDRSGSATVTPVAPDTTPPTAPGGVSALPGDAEAALSWDAVSAPDLASYRVYRRESALSDWTLVASVDGTTCTVSGLTNGTSYDFAVSARDDLGNESALSAPTSATPVAPPLEGVVGLVASAGDGQVELDWHAATDTRVIGYRVELREAADDAWEPVENGVTTVSHAVVGGLANGVEYSFSVVALAADGTESDRSDVVMATPGGVSP